MSDAPLRVVELFAGVGGFRIALEGYPKRRKANFEVVWSNQFEPRTNKQHANIIYRNRWPNANHSQEDIEEVVRTNIGSIPDHDLLVGGFPCQDFSIANRSHNRGLEGNKGKLWWSINAILEKKRPNYILLENVDRLLRSPSKQKGRDFAAILSCLHTHLGMPWSGVSSTLPIMAFRNAGDVSLSLDIKKELHCIPNLKI